MAIEFTSSDAKLAAKTVADALDRNTQALERNALLMSQTVQTSTAELLASLAQAGVSLDGLSGDVQRLTDALTALQSSETLTDEDKTSLASAVDAAKSLATRAAALDAVTPEPAPPAPPAPPTE